MDAIETELRSLTVDLGISDPIITYEGTNNEGEGYLGTVQFFTIHGNNHGNKVILHLVVKTGLNNQKLNEKFMMHTIIAREMHMYKTVFPEMFFFEFEHNVTDSFSVIPKCYTVVEAQDAIVMENLKKTGYEIFNEQLEMDAEHVKIIFSCYARFHALSFALRVRDANTFHHVCKNLHNEMFSFFKRTGLYRILTETIKKAHLSLNPETDGDAIKKHKKLLDTLDETIEQLLESGKTPLFILHGDSWSNNMLIKYAIVNGSKKPTSVRLIDFQFAYAGSSPIFDLAWFFYTCANNDVLQNLHIYQNDYYKTFSKCLDDMGLDTKTLYHFNDFKEEWRKFSKYGLIFASFFRMAMLQEESEKTNFNAECESEDETHYGNYDNIKNIEKYYERMRNVIVHMAKNGFI